MTPEKSKRGGIKLRDSVRNILPELYVHLRFHGTLTNERLIELQQEVLTEGLHAFDELISVADEPRIQYGRYREHQMLPGTLTGIQRKSRQPRSVSKKAIKVYSENTQAAQLFRKSHDIDDSYLKMIAEEGSLKQQLLLTGTLLLNLVSNYGSIRRGIGYLHDDIVFVLEVLKPAVHTALGDSHEKYMIRIERRTGALGSLDNLMDRYQRGMISKTQYESEALRILSHVSTDKDAAILLNTLSEYDQNTYNCILPSNEHTNQTGKKSHERDRPDGEPPRYKPSLVDRKANKTGRG